MGGFFAVASKESCVMDLFFGTDYHFHLGTRRGGVAVYGETDSAVPFIIYRIPHFVQNLNVI